MGDGFKFEERTHRTVSFRIGSVGFDLLITGDPSDNTYNTPMEFYSPADSRRVDIQLKRKFAKYPLARPLVLLCKFWEDTDEGKFYLKSYYIELVCLELVQKHPDLELSALFEQFLHEFINGPMKVLCPSKFCQNDCLLKPWPASVKPYQEHASLTLKRLSPTTTTTTTKTTKTTTRRRQRRRRRQNSIWARCGPQEHMLDNFDSQCLQVALGSNSYIARWKKDFACQGIPHELRQALDDHQEHAAFVALGCNFNYYYVRFRDGYTQWNGPDDFTKALESKDQTEAVVAFGPGRNSWYVRWEDDSWQFKGLPRSLSNMLNSNNHLVVQHLSLSVTTDGWADDDDWWYEETPCWFVRWRDGDWTLGGDYPSDLSKIVDEVGEDGGDILTVEFGKDDEWVLLYHYSA